MAKAILYNDLWDFYDHDGAETRCFYLPIEEEELEPYFVDYKPVIHAYWRWMPNHDVVCSKCQYVLPSGSPVSDFRFCPYCGAKMDEKI